MNAFQSLLHNEIQYMSNTSHVQEPASKHTTILHLQLLLQIIKSYIIRFIIINCDSYHHFDTPIIQVPFNSFSQLSPLYDLELYKNSKSFFDSSSTIIILASAIWILSIENLATTSSLLNSPSTPPVFLLRNSKWFGSCQWHPESSYILPFLLAALYCFLQYLRFDFSQFCNLTKCSQTSDGSLVDWFSLTLAFLGRGSSSTIKGSLRPFGGGGFGFEGASI